MAEVEDSGRLSLELASERTWLAFQRSRLGADRTLLAIMRTAMALIGFSFTALQFLQRAGELTRTTRVIVLSLVLVGFTCQVLGIWQHLDFSRELRAETQRLVRRKLLAEHEHGAHSMTPLVAIALLLVGLAATVAVIVQVAA